MAKTHYLRRANALGFDDAAFMDRSGRISEATIWNLAFWDGETVIWPQASMLDGVTQQILRRRLSDRGIAQEHRPVRPHDLTSDWSAAVMNSWSPAIAIVRFGDTELGGAADLVEALHAAYRTEAPTALVAVHN